MPAPRVTIPARLPTRKDGKGMISDGNGPVQSPTEQELRQQIALLQQQLEQAERMAALGELVSTTTHEFNNVLMTILNYAKMGLRHRDDQTRDKALDKILNAGQRAAKITNAVLGAARNRGSDFEPTDLAQLIEESLVLLERELSKYRISVEREFEDAPQVLAQPNRIQQVLLNFIINARQAMPDGGRLLLKLCPESSGKGVQLTIRDTGTGISPVSKRVKCSPPSRLHHTSSGGPSSFGTAPEGVFSVVRVRVLFSEWSRQSKVSWTTTSRVIRVSEWLWKISPRAWMMASVREGSTGKSVGRSGFMELDFGRRVLGER